MATTTANAQDPDQLAEYIATLTSSEDANLSSTGYELEALESIYPNALRLSTSSSRQPSPPSSPRIRYEITLPAWEDPTAPIITLLVSLPPSYPSSAPLLQLLGRYVGPYPIDAGLFGDITRTYISSSGVPFTPGTVAVFDGLMYVLDLVEKWYRTREEEDREGEQARTQSDMKPQPKQDEIPPTQRIQIEKITPSRPVPVITTSEPIVDRKSSFVGHACAIVDEGDVLTVVAHLLEDKRIARAAHPTIWAYRRVRDVGGAAGRVVESDYDDDGETQAGSRLKHLLEILELENVLVVVTRWFGGIHLGPDRFKHINQAARDALEAGGYLEGSGKKGKRR